jgi:hypothetical protein
MRLQQRHQVILAVGVSHQTPDVERRERMLQRIAATTCGLPDIITMDVDYTARTTLGCVPIGVRLPTSPLVAGRTVSHCLQNEDRSPEMPM